MTTPAFRPMLAADLLNNPAHPIPFPVLATPKIDGIRCILTPFGPRSRSLKPIPNQELYKKLHTLPIGLDGELVLRGGTFQQTTSVVMSHNHEATPQIQFLAFDYVSSMRYDQRVTYLGTLPLPSWCTKLIPVYIENQEELEKFEAHCLSRGHEGVMLRTPQSPYKHGRSTLKQFFLVKLKRFASTEAVITSTIPLYHNGNEATLNALGYTERSTSKDGKDELPLLGALVCQSPQFPEGFKIGSGFTQAQRADLWSRRDQLIGSTVEYKYLPHGTVNSPRHPIFLRFRRD